MSRHVPARTLDQLRKHVAAVRTIEPYCTALGKQKAFLGQYRDIFTVKRVRRLEAEEFRRYLGNWYPDGSVNGRVHWTGLWRRGKQAVDDMPALRAGLTRLLDVSCDMSSRLSIADRGTPQQHIPGIGPNISTGILFISAPEKYAVWNGRTERALRSLRFWPSFHQRRTMGDRYLCVNRAIHDLREATKADLWTLDIVWWYMDETRKHNAT